MIRIALALAAALSIGAAAAGTPAAPPVHDVVETFFGTEVHDPYRWLEDVKAPEVLAWMKATSERTHATLAAIPGRRAMFERIVKYDGAAPSRVAGVLRESGDRWFF